MKKLVYVTIALVALFAANSCKNKNNVPIISAADSVEVAHPRTPPYVGATHS